MEIQNCISGVSLVETAQKMQSPQCKSPGTTLPANCQQALPENLYQLIHVFNLNLLIVWVETAGCCRGSSSPKLSGFSREV